MAGVGVRRGGGAVRLLLLAIRHFPAVVTYFVHEKHVDALTRSVAFKIEIKTVFGHRLRQSKVFEKHVKLRGFPGFSCVILVTGW